MANPVERNDGLIILGPVGAKSDGSVLILPNQEGYRVSTKRYGIDEEEWNFGITAYDALIKGGFHREHPWFFDRGHIYDMSGAHSRIAKLADVLSGSQVTVQTDVKVTKIADLAKERLSPLAARVLIANWAVESALTDYAGEGIRLSRVSRGEELAYGLWTGEERWHEEAERLILLETESITEQGLYAVRKELKQREWVSPFLTRRQMRIYPFFQEAVTNAAYRTEAKQLRREQAPLSAYLIDLVGRDEAFHSAWFQTLVVLEASKDKAGTERDALFVARHFRMPGDYFFPDPEQTFRDYRKGLGVTPRNIARVLYRSMFKLKDFVDPNKALLVAAEYGRTSMLDRSELEDLLEVSREELAIKFETDSRLVKLRQRTEELTFNPQVKREAIVLE